MRSLLILGLLTVPALGLAKDAFVATGARGETLFTDNPINYSDAQKIQRNPVSVVNEGAPERFMGSDQSIAFRKRQGEQEAGMPNVTYTKLELLSPPPAKIFPYSLEFAFNVYPRLSPDDHILILLDGEPIVYAADTLPTKEKRNNKYEYITPTIIHGSDPKYPQIRWDHVMIPVSGFWPGKDDLSEPRDDFKILKTGPHTWQVQILNAKNQVLIRSESRPFNAIWHHSTSETPVKTPSGASLVIQNAFNILLKVAKNMITS